MREVSYCNIMAASYEWYGENKHRWSMINERKLEIVLWEEIIEGIFLGDVELKVKPSSTFMVNVHLRKLIRVKDIFCGGMQ